MEIREFAEEVKVVLEVMTGREVKIQKVRKNNGIELCGLAVIEPELNVTPTIYLEPYFNYYQSGDTIEDIAKYIYKAYMQNKLRNHIDMSWFRDWENVRNRVAYKLVNYEKNKDALRNIPHTRVMDLVKIYYLTVDTAELGSGTIQLYNSHLAMWNITTEQLEEVAAENTPKLYPVVVDTMSNIVKEMFDMGELDCEEYGAFPEIYIMTNSTGIFGAATICYGDAIKNFAQELDSDIIILPCSLHELILIPMKANTDVGVFKNIVFEVNTTEVAGEDVLSDDVYLYRRETDSIEIV